MQNSTKSRNAWQALAGGGRLVFRHQRLLWWLYSVNLALGLMNALPVKVALGGILDHSLASRALADHFDFMAYTEAIAAPGFNFKVFSIYSFLAAVLFCVFIVFMEPGILQEFRLAAGVNSPPTKQSSGEFFAACGSFFGRMIRLLLWSVIPLAAVGILRSSLLAALKPLAERSNGGVAGAKIALFVTLGMALVFLAVRAWITLSQIHLVANGEQATGRILFQSGLRLALGGAKKREQDFPARSRIAEFLHLYTVQLVTSLSTVAMMISGLAIWVKFVPPANVPLAFLISQMTLAGMLAGRLWQQASAVMWYEFLTVEPISRTAPPEISPDEQLSLDLAAQTVEPDRMAPQERPKDFS